MVQRPTPASALIATWIAWSIGPASLGITFLLCLAWPNFDDRNYLLGIVVIYTHLIGGALTLVALLQRGALRIPEMWLLIAYWTCLATGLLLVITERGEPAVVAWSFHVAVWLVAMVPLAGCVRLLRRRRGPPLAAALTSQR